MIFRNFTIVQIIKNNISYLNKKSQPRPLGRWGMCGRDDIKSFHANTDHCGDHICGNPSMLKKNYPSYFKDK